MAKSICDGCKDAPRTEYTRAFEESVTVGGGESCRACARKLARRVAKLESLVARSREFGVTALFVAEADRILARRAKEKK